MRFNGFRFHWKSILSCLIRETFHRLFNIGDRYILSFPERLAPYDRRYYYFNCGFYEKFFEHYYTFSLDEAENLRNRLEAFGDGGGGKFWNLRIYKVSLTCRSKMLYQLSN